MPGPTTPSPTAAGRADDATLKLVEDLKTLAGDVLGRGIERMFDGADDMLFEMARRASNNKDQRIYFDTMRVVRLGRPRIAKIFRDEIAAGFAPASKDAAPVELRMDELTLQDSRALEEKIAVSSMAAKAESLYGPLLFELGRRFDALVAERAAPLSREALAPATISDAFRRSAEALDVDFDVELVIFKLFDRLVISELGELYSRTLRFLDEHGVQPAPLTSGAPRGAGPGGGGAGVPGVGHGVGGAAAAAHAAPGTAAAPAGYGFAQPPMMDAATLEALRNLAVAGGVGGALMPAPAPVYPVVYGDAQLGRDLATAAAGQFVPGWEAARAYAYVQRAGAVGQMFNELMQDPTLPATLKPRFDQLRFAVIKSALRDASFFADQQHPVRNLMNELTTLAASARASGMEALRRIEELVGQIQSQFDVAADDVRSQAAVPGPVDEVTLDRFFAQQREDARQRRHAIIEKTRRVVAEELQLHTLNRKVPDGVWPLLNSGWAPLVALRLLKQGADSEGWRDGMELLRRILETTDPRRPAARGEAALDALGWDITERLRDIGMLDERIQLLLRSWREALAGIEAAALARAEPAVPAVAAVAAVSTAPRLPDASALLDEIPFGTAPEAAVAEEGPAAPVEPEAQPEPAPAETAAEAAPDPVTLLDLLMVLSSWFRVYDHERAQNRWLKVISHHPADATVTFAEFNGQNKLRMSTQRFLDDLVDGRAEPIDLGPAARRALDAYLGSRRKDTAEAA